MTTICLVRHGETDWNRAKRLQGQEDIPLNELGRRQAKECGAFLKNDQWDAIVASPLSRAKETAYIIEHYLPEDKEIVMMEHFKERAFGKGSGLTHEEINAQFPDRNYPGMESFEDFQHRIFEGLHSIQHHFPSKKVLLVAHGAVINCILSVLTDGEIGTGKTKLINACISNIERLQDNWELKSYNETTHLTDYASH
ncbi:histidine phosphatase family protein [Pontibacillus salicampi]|uniref:Histidine phosphatase family protein n=1 Tax=Pontibacillus salicampi TaxID=1449801 RepID=A0ABV6LKN8_9BACI